MMILILMIIYWMIDHTVFTLMQDYIHRVGRAARMGRKGKSLLFLTNEEMGYLPYLETLGIKLQEKKLESKIADIIVIYYYFTYNDKQPVLQSSTYLRTMLEITQKHTTWQKMRIHSFTRK